MTKTPCCKAKMEIIEDSMGQMYYKCSKCQNPVPEPKSEPVHVEAVCICGKHPKITKKQMERMVAGLIADVMTSKFGTKNRSELIQRLQALYLELE